MKHDPRVTGQTLCVTVNFATAPDSWLVVLSRCLADGKAVQNGDGRRGNALMMEIITEVPTSVVM